MNTMRILIVDDLSQVRQGLADVLVLIAKKQLIGKPVIDYARHGIEAIEKVKLFQPDVVLMDLEMPEMDGFEATRQIKAMQRPPRVIVLTIHSSPEMQTRAFHAGADSFVVKGMEGQILWKAILGDDSEQRNEFKVHGSVS